MTRPLLWLAAGFGLLALVVVLAAPPRLRGASLLLPLGAAVPVVLVLGAIAVVRRPGRGEDRDAPRPGGEPRG